MAVRAERNGTSVWLARHGRTAFNQERRFQGRLQVPLDDVGRAQAQALAERASELELASLWTSALERARETAAIVSQATGLEPREDSRFNETDAGDWTNRLFSDVRATDPERFAAFVAGEDDFAFPGGESFEEQGQRIGAALGDVVAGPLPALVVCHGMVIRLAVARQNGTALAQAATVANGTLVALG